MNGNIMQQLGAGISGGADMAAQLLPYLMKDKRDREEIAAKAAEAEVFKNDFSTIGDEWLKITSGTPKSDETVELKNEQEVVGATKAFKAVEEVYNPNATATSVTSMPGGVTAGATPVKTYELEDMPELKMPMSYDASGNPIDPENHYAIQTVRKYKDPEVLKSAWREGLINVESKGKNRLGLPIDKGKHKGEQAMGIYQIMSMHLPKIGMDPKSESDKEKFMKNTELQHKLFTIVSDEAWKKSGGDPFWASVYYYGYGGLDEKVSSAGGVPMPTRRTYANKVLSFMGLPEFNGSGTSPSGQQFGGAKTKKTGLSAVVGEPGLAEQALTNEILRGKPSFSEVKNDYLTNLRKLEESPAYIKASPAAQKAFKDNVLAPYKDAATLEKARAGQSLKLFESRTNEWGRNVRSLLRKEISDAGRKSAAARNSMLGKALTSVRSQIGRIDRFRYDYANSRKESDRKRLLEEFHEYTKKGEGDPFGPNFIWKLFGADISEDVMDEEKVKKVIDELKRIEKEITDEFMGVGGRTFQGLPEDVEASESSLFNDGDKSFVTWDDE